MPSDIQSGLEAGADLFLTKPLDCDDLRRAVDEIIRTGRIKPEASAP